MNWGDEQSEQSNSPPEKIGFALPILLSFTLALLVILYLNRVIIAPRPMHPWVGSKLNELELQPLVNAEQPMDAKQLQGKVTLINYWGPWCGFCLKEFPHLMKVKQKYSDTVDFQFVSISSEGDWKAGLPNYAESVDTLMPDTEKTLTQLESSIAVYVDMYGKSRKELNAIAPWPGYPTTLLVNREAEIVDVWLGYQPNPVLIENRVAEVLENTK